MISAHQLIFLSTVSASRHQARGRADIINVSTSRQSAGSHDLPPPPTGWPPQDWLSFTNSLIYTSTHGQEECAQMFSFEQSQLSFPNAANDLEPFGRESIAEFGG